MLALIFCGLLFSPAQLVEMTVARDAIPKDAANWDRIGLFALMDGDERRLVLLYYYDSDSVAFKEYKAKGIGTNSYPNWFSVHAVYQHASTKWTHQEVFECARVRFVRIAHATAEQLILECRPNFKLISPLPGEDADQAWNRVNKPFTQRISFVHGKLKAE
jgi:hypothetical protein